MMHAAILFLLNATQGASAQGLETADGTVDKGDVMYWEDQHLILKEISGRQVRLRVTAETKIDGTSGRLKTGDKIAAQVNSDGRALSITLQIPESGASPK